LKRDDDVQGTSSRGEGKWTAIGVTVETKRRLAALKRAFEEKLGKATTWDYFLDALLVHLGTPTWNFLIGEAVKSIKAETEPCPLPSSRVPLPTRTEREDSGKPRGEMSK